MVRALIIDISEDLRKRLKHKLAENDMTQKDFVTEAIETKLRTEK